MYVAPDSFGIFGRKGLESAWCIFELRFVNAFDEGAAVDTGRQFALPVVICLEGRRQVAAYGSPPWTNIGFLNRTTCFMSQ
jgi:hypothetical protein